MTASAPTSDLTSAPAPARATDRNRRIPSWGTWRLAIRMARRDLLRAKGRSLVVLLMVMAPTALLAAALTLQQTSDHTTAAGLPYRLGSAQALISSPMDVPLEQTGSNGTSLSSEGSPPAARIPGFRSDGTTAENAAAIGALTGGRAIPLSSYSASATIGERQLRLSALALPEPAAVGTLAELHTGRWPTSTTEVVVTPQALRRGLPDHGTVTLRAEDQSQTTATIVGTAAVWQSGIMADLLTLKPLGEDGPSMGPWLIVDRGPVDYAEVHRLSRYGLPVDSAELIRHPAPMDQFPENLTSVTDYANQQRTLMVAVGGTVLILVTGLLVAPAFAVSAARQRRTLALSASNGATRTHLRVMVLAQAVILGVVAAVVGGALGIVAAWTYTVAEGRRGTVILATPLQIPWLAVLTLISCAVLASVLAALAPTRGLGRLDIVGVMRGQAVSAPPSRLAFIASLVLIAAGATALIQGMSGRHDVLPAVGLVALMLGALLAVPRILILVARLAHRLPLPLRMATRDVARQRSRSVPAVAALVGGVAGLTALLIAVTSDTAEQAATYPPQARIGEGSYSGSSESFTAAEGVQFIKRVAPTLTAVPLSGVDFEESTTNQGSAQDVVALVPAGCRPVDAIPTQDNDRCGPHALRESSFGGGGIIIAPAPEIIRRFALTGAQAATITAGGMVVATPPGVVVPAQATLAVGHLSLDGNTGLSSDPRLDRTFTLAAVTVAHTRETAAEFPQGASMMMSPEAAATGKLRTIFSGLGLYDPDGPISAATETALQEQSDDAGYLYVERGFVRTDARQMAALVGIFTFLLLLITLTSTALSLAEQEREDSTFAAVGATRGTRRMMAAGQAFTTAIIGTIVGAAVGFVPGYAFSVLLTGRSWDEATGAEVIIDPTVVIPWASLAMVVFGAPALASIIAWLGVRRAPVVTRRTS